MPNTVSSPVPQPQLLRNHILCHTWRHCGGSSTVGQKKPQNKLIKCCRKASGWPERIPSMQNAFLLPRFCCLQGRGEEKKNAWDFLDCFGWACAASTCHVRFLVPLPKQQLTVWRNRTENISNLSLYAQVARPSFQICTSMQMLIFFLCVLFCFIAWSNSPCYTLFVEIFILSQTII